MKTRTLAMMVSAVVVSAQFTPTAYSGCDNFRFEAVAQLGEIEVAPGVFVMGGLPTPATIGGVEGLLSSILTGARPSGSKGQGASHFTLVHTFVSTDPDRPGIFTTSDTAVFVPAGKNPATGRINDVMRIVEGTGVFANADGMMINNAIVDFANGTMWTEVHGRICADGVE
ncbi:MAG TPA: hypothetical protein VF773_21945 [Verrucomicrobiae bacterium]